MKILFVAAEGVPFAKTGGLADVIGALPQELNKLGLEVRVILPKYGDISPQYLQKMRMIHRCAIHLGWRNQYCGVLKLEHQGVVFYLIDNEAHFKRPGSYGFFDDGERFSFFNRAVLEALPYLDFPVDLIHCHDWHAGMIPVLLSQYRSHPFFKGIKTAFTIHNLKFQGVFNKGILGDLLGLGWEHFNLDGVEFHDQVSFMKGGINYSDLLTTVSPGYAREIQTPFYGEGLDGVLARRQSFLKGIINGIDLKEWDPRHDPLILRNYTWRSWERKGENKLALQEALGLPQNIELPIVSMVSRLTKQKGLELLLQILPEMLRLNLQLVILGKGELKYEEPLRRSAQGQPEKMAAVLDFRDDLAHLIYAASDLFLMPSLFEPCGLGQLIAMRYGALPIVRQTGGLKDTVEELDPQKNKGEGFTFQDYNAQELLAAIEKAVLLYEQREDGAWGKAVGRAMRKDFSWTNSAEEYKRCYQQIFSNKS